MFGQKIPLSIHNTHTLCDYFLHTNTVIIGVRDGGGGAPKAPPPQKKMAMYKFGQKSGEIRV